MGINDFSPNRNSAQKFSWVPVFAWAVALGLLLSPVPAQLQHHPLYSALGNHVHVPVLAGILLLLYRYGPFRAKILVNVFTAAVFGIAIEWIQVRVDRSSSFSDLAYNTLGIALGVLIVLWSRKMNRGFLAAVFVCLLTALVVPLRHLPEDLKASNAVARNFPEIAAFENVSELRLWTPLFGSEFSIVNIDDGPHGTTNVLRVSALPSEQWPGITMQRFPLDWSHHNELCFDIRFVESAEESAIMGVRIEDSQFLCDADWHSAYFPVTKAWNEISLPIRNMTSKFAGRPINLKMLITLKIFLIKPDEKVVVDIDNIRLR